jgi:hypothetical protein
MALYEETKQIQEELNNKFTIPSYTQTDPTKYLGSQIQLRRDNRSNIVTPSTPDTDESVIYGQKDNRRYSRFFGNIYDPTYNLENYAAERQSAVERLSYIPQRVAVKVVSEVLQLPGTIGGLVAWSTTGFDKDKLGLLVNNAWQRGIKEAEQYTQDKLSPVYTSDRVKDGNIFDSIFSTSFWAKEGADGLGFLISFLLPGRAVKALNVGSKSAKLIKPGTEIASTLIKEGKAMNKAVNLATNKLAENIDLLTAT